MRKSVRVVMYTDFLSRNDPLGILCHRTVSAGTSAVGSTANAAPIITAARVWERECIQVASSLEIPSPPPSFKLVSLAVVDAFAAARVAALVVAAEVRLS